MTKAEDASPPRQTGDPITRSIRRVLMVLLVIVAIIVVAFFLDGRINGRGPLAQIQLPPSQTPSPQVGPASLESKTAVNTPTTPASTTIPPALLENNTPTSSATLASPTLPTLPSPESTIPITSLPSSLIQDEGALYLSMNESGHEHLFAYHPQSLPFTRLTAGTSDDITPSASPDGTRLAFASNRDGKWDIYILDLVTGKTSRFTDTPEYDASPSWSPDGLWLVYETYTTTLTALADTDEGNSSPANPLTPTPPVTATIPNLELLIRPVDGSQEALRLTDNPGSDFAPTWSPAGRQIAFVSNRSGENEIWLADLDRIEDRFQNLSQNPKAADIHPAWSPDGRQLAWTTSVDGYQNIILLDFARPDDPPRPLGAGELSAWGPGGDKVLASLPTPNRNYLSAYWIGSPGLALPPVPLPGGIYGMTWGSVQPTWSATTAAITPTPLWQTVLTPSSGLPSGRQRVVPLKDVQAPYAMLHDQVDESFNAMRSELASRLGWDLFSSLENAYVPLTSPLFPGMLNDWLYTGRAITLNPAPVSAGWMVTAREDFGPYTYWRIFLRTRFQDGSQGRPLSEAPWDLNARYGGDPRAYEQGGASAQVIPPGYWLDFTALAASYGWERLPALTTWRSALPAARYNEFVHTDGLDWFSAMVEIYPIEAVYTPTPVQPPTFTPTATRRPTRTPTPTRTPFPTRTPTITRTNTDTPIPPAPAITPTP
jgi:TolB protein